MDMKIKMKLPKISFPTPSQMKKAEVRSMNDIGGLARTQIIRDTAKELGITAKHVREFSEVRRATFTRPIYSLTGDGRTPGLMRFGAKETKAGVSARVWAGGKRTTFAGAFIAKSLVFKRTGEARLPVKALKGPSMGRAWARDKTQRVIDRVMRDRWDEVFTRNLKHYTKL